VLEECEVEEVVVMKDIFWPTGLCPTDRVNRTHDVNCSRLQSYVDAMQQCRMQQLAKSA
jgi:hypothetical protein